MGRPVPTDEETRVSDGYGWPAPPPRPARPASPPRDRRSRTALLPPLLALIGLAAAAVVVVWFIRVRDAPPPQRPVPAVVGMTEAAAVGQLTKDGFNVRAVIGPAKGAKGTVVLQRPTAGAKRDHGATVTIRVANGQR